MVVTRVNLRFFHLKNVLPRGKSRLCHVSSLVVFNLVSLFTILIQF